MKDKLTLKRKKFADEYLETLNATQSAIKAGYSEKYAHTNANKLLQNTTIKKYIDERMEKLSNTKIANAEEVLEFLTRVVRGEEKEEVTTRIGDDLVDCKVAKISDRTKAAELLGKRYRLFTDKVEHSGDVNVIKIVDDL